MEVKQRGQESFNGIKQVQLNSSDNQYDNNKKVKNGNTKQLPEKEFKVRNSLLTVLFEKIPHVHTIYHISYAIIILWFMSTLAHEYIMERRINLGTRIIVQEFAQLHIVLSYWLIISVTSVIFFYFYKIWAVIRFYSLPPKANYLKIWDTLAALTCLVYYISSFLIASLVISKYNLTISSSTIICMEQVRYLMKFHSFWRQSCTNVLSYKMHNDEELKLPSLSKYLYFLFAPTLLYRDEYPRIKGIRWKFVAYCFAEFLIILLVVSLAVDKIIYPAPTKFAKTTNKWEEIILAISNNIIPGSLIYLSGFYLILHVIQNLFSEVLQFGDRLFYEDWWNSTGYLDFFRLWNLIVGDWLYTYVYKDVYELLTPNKLVAKLMVFVVSAIVHEWILCNVFQCFFPVLFFEMMWSALLALLKPPKNSSFNILLWFGILLGNGINTTLYGLEYSLRRALPMENQSGMEKFYPQVLVVGD